MTIKFFITASAILFSAASVAQAVGINNTMPDPTAILDVKSNNKGVLLPRTSTTSRNAIVNPAKGLLLYDTTAAGFWFHNGSAWAQLSGGGSNYWSANGSDIFKNNGGNVGIGTNTPYYPLTVQTQTGQFGLSHTDGSVTLASYIGTSQGGLGGWLGTRSNHPLYFFTNNSAQQMSIMPNGNVGIGVLSPAYPLDVAGRIRLQNQADGNSAGVLLNNPANTAIIGFMGIADPATLGLYGNPAGWGLTMNTNTGNIGIKTLAPANKLQIGLMGPAGFNGNDMAIGNGTNAMVINQSNASALLASTTDIVLMPRNNGVGRVGINTNTPRASLDVVNSVGIATTSYSYIYKYSGNSYGNGSGEVSDCFNCTPLVSIYASNSVLATEFDAYSDARIKNIIGISNTSKDLQIINALQITDYTFKDKIKNGDKSYKKVIAQQVEKFYPQVVSKHTDFVPNVYKVANKVEKTANGYLVSFDSKHNISPSAKKLQMLLSGDKGMEQFAIISIPSETQVLINASDIKADKVFVYGEEVDDFRTVDYEGLTTLNISATQELSKQLKKQQQQIMLLVNEIKFLKRPSNKLTSAKQNIINSKTKKSKS